MKRPAFWNTIYDSRDPATLSWYQTVPETSLRWIQKLSARSDRVIDIGGGASALVDALLQLGYERPLVLDVSESALTHARGRLGANAQQVDWLVADVTQATALPPAGLWHDRAVLHFLTAAEDQAAYGQLAARTVRPGGHAVIATFAPDGPERCSGLPVQRHDAESVGRVLGPDFTLVEETREVHVTPAGVQQRFAWSAWRRR